MYHARMRRTLGVLLLALAAMACVTAHEGPAPDSTLRIYLARHGQTAWNAQHRVQGHSDIELNETGRQQAQLLRERVARIQLDHVYSSTLRRSRETAEIAHGDVALTSLQGLMEQGVGKFEGQVLDDSNPALREEMTRRSRDPDDSFDGGESENQFLARIRVTLDAIRAEHPSGSILIVGHGNTNRVILRILLDLTMEEEATIQQANDELYLIELQPGTPARLWKWIDSAHLREL